MPECSVCGEDTQESELVRCRQCWRTYCRTCSELNNEELCPQCSAMEEEEEEEGMEDLADEENADGSDDFYG
jgi:hypothetical protein